MPLLDIDSSPYIFFITLLSLRKQVHTLYKSYLHFIPLKRVMIKTNIYQLDTELKPIFFGG